LTTHYLEEAETMCDEIAIIDHGQVIACESTPDLVGRMDRKTMVIRPEGRVPEGLSLPAGVEARQRPDGTLALSYRRGQVTAGAILAALTGAGVVIADLATEEPDLEDVFLALTATHPAA
ncbi:MAG: ABC transporter ATP-binding protein, partial [Rhodobacteraceae bacterium]|nr:ABC transporter ATP-binding protein [Paracoccaceae bacterium]